MTQRFFVHTCLRTAVATAFMLSAGAARAEVLTVDNVLTLNGIGTFLAPLTDGRRVLNWSNEGVVSTVLSLPRTQDEADRVPNSTAVFGNSGRENTFPGNTPLDIDVASVRGLEDAVYQRWLGLALLYEESIATRHDDGLFYVANVLGVDQVRFEELGAPSAAAVGAPVAEPATLMLLGTAMAMAMVFARHRRRALQA